VFDPGRPLEHSLIFGGKPGAYHTVEHPKGTSLTNIKLGWKDSPGTNNLDNWAF